MSAEGVERLGKANCKRQREHDDVIDGTRTRLRCKNAKAEVQQRAESDVKTQEKPNENLSSKEEKKSKSSSSASVPTNIVYKDQPVLLKTIKPFQVETGHNYIAGIATTDEEIFIACFSSSIVFTYSTATFEFFRQFQIRELMWASDMVSCSRNNCLYIMDQKNANQSCEILKVDTNGKLILSWLVGRSYGSLSMTYDSNIVFTDTPERSIKEFSTDGSLLLVVKLPLDICKSNLTCAVKLISGHFVVSLEAYANSLHSVCLVDKKGVVLKTISEAPNAIKFNRPAWLALDSDESILVADFNNSRVLLLSSTLEFKRELLTKKDIPRLSRVSVDEPNGRIFVIEQGLSVTCCQLHVFDIK